MNECWYRSIVGVDPNKNDCNRLYPDGCSDCSYYLPELPEPEDRDKQDELPWLVKGENMDDVDKAIKGLACCLTLGADYCDDCPYNKECYCNPQSIKDGLLADTVNLLLKYKELLVKK